MNLRTCLPGGSVRKEDLIAVVWILRSGWPVINDFQEYGSAIRLPACKGVVSFIPESLIAVKKFI